ncbi:unnamed protein product [Lampetra fluviatilis]
MLEGVAARHLLLQGATRDQAACGEVSDAVTRSDSVPMTFTGASVSETSRKVSVPMTSLKGRCGDLTRKGSVSMTSHGRTVSDDVTRSDSVPMTSRGGGRPDDVTHVMASRLPARTGLILLLLPPLLLLPLLSPCQSSAVDREPLSDQKICADAECRGQCGS